MEDQLVTGQRVEILVGDATGTARLSGFVLSLRPNEMLLTFPDLITPPEGLEAGQRVTVQTRNSLGYYSGKVHILRLAMGPPLSVAVERLTQAETEIHRRAIRIAVRLPLTARLRGLGATKNEGQEKQAHTRNISSTGMLIETSLRVTIGDILDLTISGFPMGRGKSQPEPCQLSGRVVRMEALNANAKCPYGVAVELVPETEETKKRWVQFALEIQHSPIHLADFD